MLHLKTILRVLVSGVFLMSATLALAQSDVEEDQIGYSYMRIEVAGRSILNFAVSPKYQDGWLQIEVVEVHPANFPASRVPALKAEAAKQGYPGEDGWLPLDEVLQSGWRGRGTIRFGAGDSGGFAPMLEAQKNRTAIEHADLDLYALDTRRLVGKFRIDGIHVLAMDDVPASACPMYEVTLSFRSIMKRETNDETGGKK
jgi:hypothetical protein